ncbi:pyroglutamyl-peptidase I [Guggenheimella bovis]
MRVLITGFDPFGNDTMNPSFEAVKRLPDEILGAEVIKLQFRTSFEGSQKALKEALEKWNPDLILHVGQAGGRGAISIEKVAINYMDARIPDNDNAQPKAKAISPTGETAYFTTLPVHAILKALRKESIPCELSLSAGSFVCNTLFYALMEKLKGTEKRGGFIHVPYMDGQVENAPSMSLEQITKALEIIIQESLTHKTDIDPETNEGSVS